MGIALFLLSAAAAAQQPPPRPQGPERLPIGMNAPAVSPVERVGDGLFRIGKVNVDKKQRSISFPASVNMAAGLLEYVLVRRGGKTHESLLRTDSEPYDIQLACLLLDFTGTDQALPYQGAAQLPKGDRIRLTLTLPDGSVIGPERWLSKVIDKQKHEVSDLEWVYTGSWINQGRFMAQVDGSIVALYHDPVAIIDHASPGGESDRVWFVREGVVPPVGTAVTVTIKPLK